MFLARWEDATGASGRNITGSLGKTLYLSVRQPRKMVKVVTITGEHVCILLQAMLRWCIWAVRHAGGMMSGAQPQIR